MKCFIISLCALFLAVSLTGCRKEDPNPELLDPIYADLQKRAADAQKSFEDETAKHKDMRLAVEKAEPNSIELKNARKDLAKSLKLAVDMEQAARYYKIRAQRRLLVDKITYKEAFVNNQPWPDPAEYSAYQVNMRLNAVNLNWNTRVPKLQKRLEKAPVKAEGGKEEGEKKEH